MKDIQDEKNQNKFSQNRHFSTLKTTKWFHAIPKTTTRETTLQRRRRMLPSHDIFIQGSLKTSSPESMRNLQGRLSHLRNNISLEIITDKWPKWSSKRGILFVVKVYQGRFRQVQHETPFRIKSFNCLLVNERVEFGGWSGWGPGDSHH